MALKNRRNRDEGVARLYAAENEALEHAETALTRQQLSAAVYEPFRELTRHYRRLLRQSMKITAVSDSAQLQLRNTSRDLTEALARVEQLNQELRAMQKEKDELFAMAVHDLKSPLSGICGLANLIAGPEPIPPQELQEMARHISLTGEGILTMVANLVEIYRLETVHLSFETSRQTLADLREKIEALLDVSARRKHSQIRFRIEDPADSIAVALDPFLRIADNLVSNALKYSPPGSTVGIRLAIAEGKLRLSVSDQGPGISAADQKKLFLKFTRLTARPTAGETSSGLGLAIVKRLVDRLGGEVWCESSLGQGASFHVLLPQPEPAR